MKDLKLLGSTNGQFYGDYNDISYDAQGKVVTITGTPAARQAIVKLLLTEQDQNNMFPNYGTLLHTVLNSGNDITAMQAQITNYILAALTYYNNTIKDGNASELIQQIVNINVQWDSNETFNVTINLQMQDGSLLTIPLGS